MPKIADLEARITADTGDFDKKVNRSRDELGRFVKGAGDGGKEVGKFGGILQVLAGNILTTVVTGLLQATKAVVAFGDECADAASDVSESVSKINTLFGKSAREVEKWSQSTASSLGLSRRASLEAAGNYGNLFKAMNFGEKQSSQFSMSLVKMAADFASFNNTSVEQAIGAIRSGLTGESEPLRAYGVILSDATLKQEALRTHLISTTKDGLTPQTKALATMSLMTKQTAAAQGDFAKTAAGAANAQRVLSARFEDFKTKIGEITLPLKTQAIATLNNLMEVLNRIDFKAVMAAFQAFFSEIASGIQQRVKPATDFILSMWQKVVAWFNENLPLIQRTVQTVLTTIQQFWRDHGQQIYAVVSSIWEQIKNTISFALDVILGVLKAAMQVITGDWEGLGKTLQSLVEKLLQFLERSVENIGKYIESALTAILSGLGDLLSRLLQGLVGALTQNIIDVGKMIGGGIADAIGFAFGDRAKAIADAIGGWVGSVAQAARKELLSILPGGSPVSTPVAVPVRRGPVGMGDVRDTERRETPDNPSARLISRLQKGMTGGSGTSTFKMPSMGSLLKGVKPTDSLIGGDGDDKAAKKAKRDAEQHARGVLDARKELADKLAQLTLSEWDQQRRELNQYVAEYKKKTGDLTGARKIYAVTSKHIAEEQGKAEQAVIDQMLAGWVKESEESTKKAEEAARKKQQVALDYVQFLKRLEGQVNAQIKALKPLISPGVSDDLMDQARDSVDVARDKRRFKGITSPFAAPTLKRIDTTQRDMLADQFRGISGEGFLSSLTGGKQGMKRFWGDVVSTGQQALLKLGWSEILQPQLKGLFGTLKEGLNASLSGLVATAATIINAAYGLMQAMQGGKRGAGALIGAVLGGIAGSLIPGIGTVAGISFGSSFGGAVAGGNMSEIFMTGLTGAASLGAFGSGGTKVAGGGNALPDGANLDARLRPVNQNVTIYGGVNNAASLNDLSSSLAGNMEASIRVP